MHPFSAGEVVVCIDDEPLADRIIWPPDPWVCKGRIYRIKELSSTPDGEHGVHLTNLDTRPNSLGWYAWRFRRLEVADAQFMKMLAAPVRELEDA